MEFAVCDVMCRFVADCLNIAFKFISLGVLGQEW
jgi:hypothetical protein